MKKIAIMILAMAVGFGATAKQNRKTKKKKKEQPSSIVSVTMHRTACFGRCPDYTIEIDHNGNVTYTGIRFVDDSGVYTKNIGRAKAITFINQLASYKVDTCREMYETRIPDLPGINYEIKYTNKVQKIITANGGPAYLSEMATAMDDVGKKNDDKAWKKVEPAKKK